MSRQFHLKAGMLINYESTTRRKVMGFSVMLFAVMVTHLLCTFRILLLHQNRDARDAFERVDTDVGTFFIDPQDIIKLENTKHKRNLL
jgi:hypothetical protein